MKGLWLTCAGLWAAWGVAASTCAADAISGAVLVEAESFPQRGGWVVDPQFMDVMGSPYLLAHGLGRPVADAATDVEVPAAGTYRTWVRTKDWVAQWNAPGAPGRFQVLIGGKPLAATFGTEGAQWHWQDGGPVDLPAGKIALALHDLTGFEGRCDAILLARDLQFTPPNAEPALTAFRRQCLKLSDAPESAGQFDLVVCGGGIAGTCAALSAARLGLTVALIQDRPVLGGNNSSEVRVWLQGARNKEPWPRVGDVVAELEQDRRAHYGPANTAELYEDEKKLAVVRAEPNIRLFLEHRVNAVEVADGRIRAVIAQEINTARRVRFTGRWFADCTGDAAVGALAGADFEMETQGHMGPCNLWNVCECDDKDPIGSSTAAGAGPQPFPRCPWALDLSDKPFPGRDKQQPNPSRLGGWEWESGFDRDPIRDLEAIRDWNFRAMYGAWDALKNVDQVLPNHRLNWSAYILGKRESRRLLGDVVLTLADLETDRQFPDGCVPTGWSNDLHVPDPRYDKGFEGQAFISKAIFGRFPAERQGRPFWIPYRALYSRNIANLFMAGRDLSTKHEALGAVRVMRTGGCMGEVVGMATSLCKRYDTLPRAVYEQYLDELKTLLRNGVGRNPGSRPDYDNGHEPKARRPQPIAQPAWLPRAGTNLARQAKLSAPRGTSPTPLELLTDGRIDLADNDLRWKGEGPLPHEIECTWPAPVTIGAARIASGYASGGKVTAPLSDFSLQWHDGSAWRDVPGTQIHDNQEIGWAATFAPVTTTRLRLLITATPKNVSRIWELELFGPVKE